MQPLSPACLYCLLETRHDPGEERFGHVGACASDWHQLPQEKALSWLVHAETHSLCQQLCCPCWGAAIDVASQSGWETAARLGD